MKRLICWFFGHQWRPFKGEYTEPYCIRCGKQTTLEEIFKVFK